MRASIQSPSMPHQIPSHPTPSQVRIVPLKHPLGTPPLRPVNTPSSPQPPKDSTLCSQAYRKPRGLRSDPQRAEQALQRYLNSPQADHLSNERKSELLGLFKRLMHHLRPR